MTEKLKEFLKSKKGIIILIITGILGMLLFAFSNKIPKNETVEIKTMTDEEYCKKLEEKVKKIVVGITGDKNAVAVITLDTGVKYYYADATENKQGDTSSESSQSYITVKNADGGEQAIVVNSKMPEVRGVAIVCKTDEKTATLVLDAVSKALNITSKRCSVVTRK